MFHGIHFNQLKKYFLTTLLLLGLTSACLLILYVFSRYPLNHINLIKKYGKENDLPPEFICAVIHAESKFKKEAKSHKGASGLMQLTEPTAIWLSEKMALENFSYHDIFNPDVNVQIGCYYLRLLINQFHDKDLALMAYNAGSGNVNKWLSNARYSNDGKTLKHIPFPETENYLKRVHRNEKIYHYLIILYEFIHGGAQ